MSHFIYPTVGNVGQFGGFDCRELQEEQLTQWMKIRGSSTLEAFVSTGLNLSAAGGLSVNISAGTAMVDGFAFGTTGSESLSGLTNSVDNYIYAQLTFSGGLAVDFIFVSNTTGTVPADAVMIGVAACSGGSVISVINLNHNPRTTSGSYTGDGGTSRDIVVGFQPKLVIVSGLGTGGANYSMVTAIGFGASAGATLGGVITNAASFISDSALATRPQITVQGFKVGGTSGGELNANTQIYLYVALI